MPLILNNNHTKSVSYKIFWSTPHIFIITFIVYCVKILFVNIIKLEDNLCLWDFWYLKYIKIFFSVFLNNFCNNSILLIVLIFATLFATCNKKIYRRKKRALKKWSWGRKVRGRLNLFQCNNAQNSCVHAPCPIIAWRDLKVMKSITKWIS